MEKYAAAIDMYKKGLALDPDNAQMKAGLRDVETKWVVRGSGMPEVPCITRQRALYRP